jgi:RNA polymerase primary sigma factor
MGSVSLLTREGEVALARCTEAGRDMMFAALSETPFTFRAIHGWHAAVLDGSMPLRDVIDLEATLGSQDAQGDSGIAAATEATDDSAFDAADGDGGPSISALEATLRPAGRWPPSRPSRRPGKRCGSFMNAGWLPSRDGRRCPRRPKMSS